MQEYNHFIHYSEQLQLADDDRKAELWISLEFAQSFTFYFYQRSKQSFLTSGFCFFVEEFTPVVSRLKQSLWSGHGKYLNLLFFVVWIAFLTKIEVFKRAIEIPSQDRSTLYILLLFFDEIYLGKVNAIGVLNYCRWQICQFTTRTM